MDPGVWSNKSRLAAVAGTASNKHFLVTESLTRQHISCSENDLELAYTAMMIKKIFQGRRSAYRVVDKRRSAVTELNAGNIELRLSPNSFS